MAENADLGLSGLPPKTQHAPSGYVTPEMPGYTHPSAAPSGNLGVNKGVTAPGQSTSKEMMSKMGTPPGPSPTQ